MKLKKKVMLNKSLFILIIYLNIQCSFLSKQKEIVFVKDKEEILTNEQEKQLDSLFREHEKRTSNEILLVTTPDYNGEPDLFTYSLKYFNKIGIGKKELNNGVGIFLCNANHETRIITGYGTEKVLKDELVKKIIDSLMIPQFKQDKIFEGLWAGSKAIVEFLDRPENKIVKKEM